MAKRRAVPEFASEDEERDFWATHDSTQYVDWARSAPAVLPELKASTRSISLRMPESLIEGLKLLANQRDVPYQSLLKIFLAERVEKELHSR